MPGDGAGAGAGGPGDLRGSGVGETRQLEGGYRDNADSSCRASPSSGTGSQAAA